MEPTIGQESAPAGGAPARKPRRGDELELLVEGLDDRGRPVGSFDGHRVRIQHGVVGERVRAGVRRRRGGIVEAERLETLAPSPQGVAPRCVHFSSCGGCSYQDLAYAGQLAELQRLVERVAAPLTDKAGVQVDPILGCDAPWHYRNKMDFTFGSRRWIEPHEEQGVDAGFAVGLHVPGRFDKVLDVGTCDIAFEQASAILGTVRKSARRRGLAPWDVRAHVGLLRHLVLRKSFGTGEVMVDLVTSEDAHADVDALAADVLAAHPEVTTFVQNVNTRLAAIAVGERERVLTGTGRIVEELGGLRFSISANSFFQTNTLQARRLVELVREEAGVARGDVVFDVCCGAGVLGLCVGRDAQAVWGFDLVQSAIDDALVNAELNGSGHTRFVAGDVTDTLRPEKLADLGAPRPDVCIVDPPRAGLHPNVAGSLAALAPERLVYVSCNPRSAVADLEGLVEGDYDLVRVRPIDLFPHTPHVECVFTLRRRPR